MYTAPLKGALFVSCWGIASGFAIGSATQKVKNDKMRCHGATTRIMLEAARLPEEEAGSK